MITRTQIESRGESAEVRVLEQGALRRYSEKVIGLTIFAFSLAYLCIFLRYTSIEPDEGIVLQGAERVMLGQIPYRDFFSFYTPGSFYLAAFTFKIFGDSFVVARAGIALAGSVCSVITYLLARRTCSRSTSIFAAILATTCGAAFRFLVLHNVYSTLLCSLATYAAVRFLESDWPLWAAVTGSLGSLTLLVEQSKGAGLLAGLLLGFTIVRAAGLKRYNQRSCAAFLIGLLWPLSVTVAYFAAHGAAKIMLACWIWPLHHYTQANRVPYGFQNWTENAREAIFHTGPVWIRLVKIVAVSPGLLIPVLPLIAVALLCFWGGRVLRGAVPATKESSYYVLVSSILAGLLFSVIIARADVLHFIYLAPLWFVVLAWILGSERVPGRLLPALRPYLLAYSIAAFGLLGFALLFATTGAREHIATRRGMITTGARDTVVEFVEAHVGRNSGLLVYPYLPLYNYLTATHSPSRLDYFQPGMNTAEQAQQIVASLKSDPSVPVLFEPWFSEKIANSWPGTPLGAVARDPVADYIVRNYRVCKMLNSPDGWRFHYMLRKEFGCP